VNGKTMTGPDLLKRAIFYKVGHHGSHNATLKEKGLEEMERLRVAMIPVDPLMRTLGERCAVDDDRSR
jgi:hypothetical protein